MRKHFNLENRVAKRGLLKSIILSTFLQHGLKSIVLCKSCRIPHSPELYATQLAAGVIECIHCGYKRLGTSNTRDHNILTVRIYVGKSATEVVVIDLKKWVVISKEYKRRTIML
jgi:hypothetical protein